MDPNYPNNVPPNMGTNFQTLASMQPSQSVVPGGNPAGNIGTASQAGFLGMDAARRDAFIQQASGLAAMDAQNKAQQSNEYMAGAPARSADISTNNALSQGKLSDIGSLLGAQSDKNSTAATKAKQAKATADMQNLAPYVDLWANSDPDTKALIKERMQKDGVKIGQHDVTDIPDPILDRLMKSARSAGINSVGEIQKEQQIAAQGKAWVDRMNATGASRIEVERMKQAGQDARSAALIKAKADAAKIAAKPETTSQYEAEMQKKLAKYTDTGDESDMTQGERDTYMMYLKNKLANSAAHAANTPPTLSSNALPPGMLNPPSVPAPAAFPTPQSKVDPKAATLLSTYQQRVKANPASKAAESAALLGSSAFKSLDPQTQEQVKKLVNG